MSNQALLATWIIGFVVTAWLVARYGWQTGTYADDPYLIDYAAPFLVGLLWPVVLPVGTVVGLLWLFIQATKPGRVRLPKRKPRASIDDGERATLEARINQLEAELGMRGDA